MRAQPKNPRRNGSASSRTKLAVFLLHAMALFSAAIAANQPDGENLEFFFGCSDGELSTVQTFIEKDPLLAHAVTQDGEHCQYCMQGEVGGKVILSREVALEIGMAKTLPTIDTTLH